MNKSIFVERNILENNTITLITNEIMSSIPKEATDYPNDLLIKSKTEWRWRVFQFPNRPNNVIEISFKKVGAERMFMNNRGNWVEYNMPRTYDKLIIKQFYCYIDQQID
jgi:hypothetical protein